MNGDADDVNADEPDVNGGDADVTDEAEGGTTAIEAKRSTAVDPDRGLTSEERRQFVDRLAIMAEHVRRLATQVQQLNRTPCIEPPPREVIVKPGPSPRDLERLRSELRVAESQVEEHVRQKAALRVQVNQLTSQLASARAEAEKSNKAAAAAANVKTAPQSAALTRPPRVPSTSPTAALEKSRDLVLAFLRGRASSANVRFIAERIGCGLTATEVQLAITALNAAGLVVLQDLAGSETWKAKP